MTHKNKTVAAAYAKAHYAANKESYRARAKKFTITHRTKIKRYILEFLLKHPCIECGEDDPIVLEFDHIDHEKKKFAIGMACGLGVGLKTLINEIEKCQVLCANCHRRKTYAERNLTHRDV